MCPSNRCPTNSIAWFASPRKSRSAWSWLGRSVGRQVVVEKRLQGQELSLFALVGGRAIVPLPATQDHKPVFDNDEGPNTGGMGAYCPTPLATPELLAGLESNVLVPMVHA